MNADTGSQCEILQSKKEYRLKINAMLLVDSKLQRQTSFTANPCSCSTQSPVLRGYQSSASPADAENLPEPHCSSSTACLGPDHLPSLHCVQSTYPDGHDRGGLCLRRSAQAGVTGPFNASLKPAILMPVCD